MAFDINTLPSWMQEWSGTQSPTIDVNAKPNMTYEQWMQSTGQYLPSGGSQEEYLRSGVSGVPNPIMGGNQYASPNEADQPYLRGYSGTSSDWMTNPDTGKVGQLYSEYGTSGDLSNILWRDKPDKNTWIDKALDIAPYAIGGIALASGLGAFGAASGSAGATGAAAPISASTPSWTAGMAAPAYTTPVAAPMAAATPLYAAGSAAPGATVAGAAAGAGGAATTAGGAAASSIPSWLQRAGNYIPALYNAYTQQNQGQNQQDVADELMGDRRFFLDRLMQSHTDPNSYLQSPEYQSIADIELNRLMRRDAAGGRLGNDVDRQRLMQQFAFQNLGNYRTGLSRDAGLSGNPLALGQYGVEGQANQDAFLNAALSTAGRNGDIDKIFNQIFDLGDF